MVVPQKYIAAGYIRFHKLKAALLFGIQAFIFPLKIILYRYTKDKYVLG